ncbi:MAG: hypothetical protein KDH89_01905 [Anaerolineae bacterium]|nr:hypothetical protein [Anaerolineae bacterium]
MSKRIWMVVASVMLVSLLATSCGGGGAAPALKLAPASELPDKLRDAPANVQEAYRFAIANKELLEQIPCFCGCVAEGHKSNYNCYVAEDGGPGTILEYDYHALG